MTKRDFTQAELDVMFLAQRHTHDAPSADFMERIAQDAARSVRQVDSVPPKPAFAARLRAALQGLLGAGGLSGGVIAAGLAGVWIGVSAPQGLPDPALLWSAQVESEDVDLSSLVDDIWFAPAAVDEIILEDG